MVARQLDEPTLTSTPNPPPTAGPTSASMQQAMQQAMQPAGGVDVAALADAVYGLLVRRLAGERERRGY